MDENRLSKKELYAQAQKSGLTYNEAKRYIAETTGGLGTRRFSDTDIEAVKKENERIRNKQLNKKNH